MTKDKARLFPINETFLFSQSINCQHTIELMYRKKLSFYMLGKIGQLQSSIFMLFLNDVERSVQETSFIK